VTSLTATCASSIPYCCAGYRAARRLRANTYSRAWPTVKGESHLCYQTCLCSSSLCLIHSGLHLPSTVKTLHGTFCRTSSLKHAIAGRWHGTPHYAWFPALLLSPLNSRGQMLTSPPGHSPSMKTFLSRLPSSLWFAHLAPLTHFSIHCTRTLLSPFLVRSSCFSVLYSLPHTLRLLSARGRTATSASLPRARAVSQFVLSRHLALLFGSISGRPP